MVLETVGLRHTAVHVKVGRQGDLLRRGRLLGQPVLALAGGGRASLRVRTCVGEGSQSWNVGLPVRTAVGRQARAGGEGFLKRPRAEQGVALVGGAPQGRARAGRRHPAGLAPAAGLEAVRGGRQRRLGLRGRGRALAVLGLGQRQIIGAVPLGAAGFGELPERGAVLGQPPAVGPLRLLSLPA